MTANQILTPPNGSPNYHTVAVRMPFNTSANSINPPSVCTLPGDPSSTLAVVLPLPWQRPLPPFLIRRRPARPVNLWPQVRLSSARYCLVTTLPTQPRPLPSQSTWSFHMSTPTLACDSTAITSIASARSPTATWRTRRLWKKILGNAGWLGIMSRQLEVWGNCSRLSLLVPVLLRQRFKGGPKRKETDILEGGGRRGRLAASTRARDGKPQEKKATIGIQQFTTHYATPLPHTPNHPSLFFANG